MRRNSAGVAMEAAETIVAQDIVETIVARVAQA